MKSIQLSQKKLSQLCSQYHLDLNKKDQVELREEKNYKIIFLNKQPFLFYYGKQILPTLKYLQNHEILRKITVDMGAIKYIINGADIMRPGIKKIEPGLKENEFVVIIDENNQKPLAVGKALFSSEEMEIKTSGKVIKNIHYVGDKLWRI